MVIDVSPFDEKAQLFFSTDQESTIKEMVEEKKTALKAEGKTDAEIDTEIKAYEKELKEYKTYVDIKGGEKVSDRNKIIEELEEIVKTYAKRGTTTESVSPDEQFLTYDMVEYYMEKEKVTFKNQELKNKIQEYISNQKALIDSKTLNTIADGWQNYYSRAKVASSKEIQMKKIPIECSFYTSGDKDKLKPCTYSYEKGFKIKVEYDTNGGSFNEDSAYSKYFYIGQAEEFILPTATDITKEGATFGGWYYTSTFDEGTEVTSIITSRSTVKNKTKLYAKWINE